MKEYYRLRDALDIRCAEVADLHKKNMQCQRGCDSCCESIKVFPIEFYAIKKELGDRLGNISNRSFNFFRKSCMFLQDGACIIYNSRPFICRTQGLPLMYQSIKTDGYEVSHCQLNFKKVSIDSFTLDTTVFMPDFNSKLFLMNQVFVRETDLFKGDIKKRIALYKLKNRHI